MQKEEITGGLKSALERGYSLEDAKQSFINAGYNPRDVEDSANVFSGGVLQVGRTVSSAQSQVPIQEASQKIEVKIPRKKRNIKAIILIIVLTIILLSLLGVLGWIILDKESFTNFLGKIGFV